jgi:hypothetical protein
MLLFDCSTTWIMAGCESRWMGRDDDLWMNLLSSTQRLGRSLWEYGFGNLELDFEPSAGQSKVDILIETRL